LAQIHESSPLDLASEEPERLPCLQRLLDLGADVNAADKNGKRDAERLRALLRAGEMAQRVKALTALLKVMSSNPSNHMVAHNHP
jgi:hypothetical protein